jgi:hypothetical protein
LLGLLVVFLAMAVAPAAGAGGSPVAPERGEARQDLAVPARRTAEPVAATAATPGVHRTGVGTSVKARRADGGGLRLLAVLAVGPGSPCGDAAVGIHGDPGPSLRTSVLAPHCGRGPPAV